MAPAASVLVSNATSTGSTAGFRLCTLLHLLAKSPRPSIIRVAAENVAIECVNLDVLTKSINVSVNSVIDSGGVALAKHAVDVY